MSAECSKCGFDIVYPVGTWPLGVCQNCEQQDEIARLREFGEHYSGAAQDAWDRIGVLEKALREIYALNSTLGSIGQYAVIARDALAAGSASPGGAET